jgi:HTH-type transcriptional regulator/antitoxin HipB
MRTKAINQKSLGIILRSTRKNKGLTQAETGRVVGADQTTISNIERGESNLHIDTLFRILAALDMEMIVRPRERASNMNEGDTW